ncbi:MAG: chromosome segregation ATPase [Bacillariaceae sp.]
MAASLEVCNIEDDFATILAGHNDDVWGRILRLTRETVASKRKSLEAPKQDTPHHWQEYNKHTALSNLLSIAVSHKDLQLRKSYIERIMTLSPRTQRLLMSMIEKRKKSNSRNKTPSKNRQLRSASSIKKRENEETFDRHVQTSTDKSANRSAAMSPYRSKITTPIGSPNRPAKSASVDRYSMPVATNTGQSMTCTKDRTDGPSLGLSSNKKSQESSSTPGNNSVSTPTFLRREAIDKTSPEPEDVSRRSFNDAFGSPLQQPSAKRLPPPSTERNRIKSYSNRMFSPGLGDTAEYESQVQGLRDENEELTRELKKSRQKEEELSKKMDDIEEHYRKEMLKVEREARERDDNTKQEFQTHISQIQVELVQVTEECTKIRNERDEFAKIKDEMEVMSHNKMLLEETTERLRTYKEKVQQFSDVKDALQREEEAHSRSVEENLRLQNELQNLQPLKRQLEEYKNRTADAEVRLTDCQDELTKLKEQKMASSDVNTEMEQHVSAQDDEIKELLRRVQQNDAADKEGSSVGDGISELNPELKTEILSLRNENTQLRAFAEKRQEDEVTKLEQSAEDKNMLAERYKAQFLTTKDKLESTEMSLGDSRSREAKLQEEVHDKTKQAERFKSQFISTKTQLESTQLSLQDSKEREGSLRKELADSLEKIKDTQNEVEDLSKQLFKCTEDLNTGFGRESRLEQELASWTGEAKDLQEKSNDLSRRLTKTIEELENSQKKESSLLMEVSDLTSDVCVLQERCDGLSDELQNYTVELEQSHCRETRLEISVKEWTERAQESHEHASSLSSDLAKRAEDLKESTNYTARLEIELSETSELKQEAEVEIEKLTHKLSETTSSLEKTCQSLDQSMQRYLDLQNDLTDMNCRAEDAERISKQRMELVQSTREKLRTATQNTEDLTKEKEELISSVERWTSETDKARNLAENLDSELNETRHSLNDTEEKLSEAQVVIDVMNREKELLTTSVAKWTSETDEAKYLAKNLKKELETTLHLLNGTNEKLAEARVLNDNRRSEIEIMTSDSDELKRTIVSAEKSISDLQNELRETNESLKLTQANTKELEAREKVSNEMLLNTEDSIISLQKELLQTTESLKSTQVNAKYLEEREKISNEQLQHAENSITRLQKKLDHSAENLKSTEENAKAQEARERSTNEQLQSAEQMISELESSVEKEVQARGEVLDCLEKLQLENSTMKTEFEIRGEKLKNLLESEKEKGIKLKQELSVVKDAMNGMQVSFSSSQHREKMLKHEVAKLQDKNCKSENELSNLKSTMDDALEQSSKSLEAVREIMNAKAQKELKELQRNMNQLLEDESKAKRQQDIMYKEQISRLNQQYNKELMRLKEDGNVGLEKYTDEKDTEIQRLKDEYEEKISFMERVDSEEKEKLMTTGKGMMKDIKEKKEKQIRDLNDDVDYLEKTILKLEQEKQTLEQKNNNLGNQTLTKIAEYKKKLHVSSSRINTLSADNNDYEDTVKLLERERFKLKEENDRYRRQIVGRSGSDCALQSQFETLQNEYKDVVEEIEELKRQLQDQDNRSLASIGEEESQLRPYTRNRANNTTLFQQRKEFGEIIDILASEKRQLVMKSSASFTTKQKAEQRVWEVEQENEKLKQNLTSLKLSKERMENMPVDVQGDAPIHDMSVSDDILIPKPPFQFEDDTSVGVSSYQSRNYNSSPREDAILVDSRGHNLDRRSNFGLQSPDHDIKRLAQSPTIYAPHRTRSLR